MAKEFGIDLTLQDNASAAARRAAEGLEQVATAADGINSALDPNVLDAYNQKLTEIGQAYSKLDRGMKLRDQYQAQQSRMMFAGAGSTVRNLTQGNIAGTVAGASQATGLTSLIEKIPKGSMLGAGIAGVIALAGANVLAGEAYYKRSAGAEMVAGLEGGMGTDIAANTQALHRAMRSTVDAVSKYGKTYEEGTKAAETFLKAGGTDFAGTSQAAAYSLARKADFNRLASFEGMTQRYGIEEGLGIVDALRMAQGLDIGQFEEVMGGYQDIVTSRLGRGISGGGEDIATQLEYFAKAGVTWQGALGAQKVQGLNQTVAGAAGLQQQSDLFLYRAAAGITAKTGGGLIETQMLMEKGLSQELFKGTMGQFGQMGYDREETIKQLQSTLKISTTDAHALYNMYMRGESVSGTKYEGVGGLPEGEGVSARTQWIGGVEQIKQFAAEIFGKAPFEAMAKGIDFISNLGGGDGAIGEITTPTIKAGQIVIDQSAGYHAFQDNVRGVLTASPGTSGYMDMLQLIMEGMAAGVTDPAMFQAIGGPFAAATSRRSPGGEGLTEQELTMMEKLLMELIKATDRTTDAVNGPTILEDSRGDDSGSNTPDWDRPR